MTMQDSKLEAVQSTVQMMAGVVDAYVITPRNAVSPDAVFIISGLYQEKATGRAVPSLHLHSCIHFVPGSNRAI